MTESDRQAQLDEVEVLQAMCLEEEFEWREEKESGTIFGTLSAFPQLEVPLILRSVRREKASPRKNVPQVSAAVSEGSSSHAEATSQSQAASVMRSSDSSVGVSYLPPICLHFQLPVSYPSHEKPVFTLSCKWLNFSQLSLLCQQLDQIWERSCGSVVLFDWQSFLASEVLSHLGLSTELPLEFQDPTAPKPTWDPRAIQDIDHPRLMLSSLIEYNSQREEKVFADSFFDCEICFLSLLGSKCVRMTPCGHVHCRDCLRCHVSMKIQSGDVTKVDCLDGSCQEIIPPSIIKELVTPDIFERYDRLLLQRTLDGMQDVVYCPRPSCRCVTMRDDSNMAQCPRCMFSFCVLCKRVWHGVAPCKLLPSDLEELRDTWDSLDANDRRVLEKQFGKARLHKAFEEFDSYKWIESNAKLCPHCNAKIQKMFGCNKMTCTHCRGHFCWLCDAALPWQDPYRHFRIGNSPCAGRLFEGLEPGEDDFFF